MNYFLSALLLLNVSSAFAWGPTGHRVVGEIATKYLNIETLSKVHKILDGQSLARVSTWPDEIKSDPANYSHTYNWHYTTWHSDVDNHSHDHETEDTGYLLSSVREQTAILNSPHSTQAEKAFAIKFLVHLVGDAHMPFHVGNGFDRGGNYCKVTFHGKQFNLHSLWDEGMIDFEGLSFTELERFIREGKTLTQLEAARQGEFMDWVKESKEILPTLYPAMLSEGMNYCAKDSTWEMAPKLGYEYSYQYKNILERRLFEAGVRLAKVLNQNLQ